MRGARVTLRPSPFLNFALTARVLRCSTLVDRVDDNGAWTRAIEALVTRLFLLDHEFGNKR